MTSKQKLVGDQHQQQTKQLLLNTNGKSSSTGKELQKAADIDHRSTGTTKVAASNTLATRTTTTTTTGATTSAAIATSLTGTKLWTYFERSISDNSKLRCTLCSIELCNYDDILQSSSTSLFLWNHLRVKHEIGEPLNLNSESEQQVQQRQQHYHYPKQKHSNHHSSNSSSATTIIGGGGGGDRANNNMTNHKHHRLKQASSGGPPQGQGQGEPGAISKSRKEKEKSSYLLAGANERRNRNAPVDLLDHYDTMMMPSKASLKPLPSSSLSKNLFARLNQISEPVTRKLKFWNKKSFQVNQYDPCFKVIYLGNLGIQFWSKDESCLDKPLNTLWNNYLVNMKTEIIMRLTICNSGLKAITRQHGLTQYWSNRLVYCCSHKNYPKIFAWIYRHEGKKMRQELRCHAVFCSSPDRASKMVSLLSQRLACALQEFKREKKSRGGTLPPLPPPPRLGIMGETTGTTKDSLLSAAPSTALAQRSLPRTVPLRRQILAKGTANFRPPLERSKSAPKLTSIREEDYESDEEEEEEVEEEEAYEEDLYELQQEEDEDDISRDEFEYEQSFGDRDDDDDSDFNGHESSGGGGGGEGVGGGKLDDDGESAHKIESNSLSTTANEEISNSSSVYATTGDISYDNIVVNKHHLLTNQERLDNESTQTAPELTAITSANSASSSLQRRGSQIRRRPTNSHRSHQHHQHMPNESSGDFTDATSSDQELQQPHSVGSYQHDLDGQIAAEREQAAASNATITNFSHITSCSGSSSAPAAGPDRAPKNRESSANIMRQSEDNDDGGEKEETSSSNKLNYTKTTLSHQAQGEKKKNSKDNRMAANEADHSRASGADNNLATTEVRKFTPADSRNNIIVVDPTTAPQEPAAAAAAVDESTQQDIISSWSNNLLIK